MIANIGSSLPMMVQHWQTNQSPELGDGLLADGWPANVFYQPNVKVGPTLEKLPYIGPFLRLVWQWLVKG